MPDASVQIFISYSRDDNAAPPDIPGARGFVEFLQDQLRYKFRTSGPFRPDLWRDIEQVSNGEPFPRRLEQELDKSSLLLIVLSPNWMESAYCRQELEYFKECRRRANEPIDERIIVVEKNPVPIADRPSGIEHQVGFQFYKRTNSQVRSEIEFFERGEPTERNLYWSTFDELFARLRNASARLQPTPTPAAPSTGRTVYVAKPASDMFDDYIRVVAELTKKGYNVVPNRSTDIRPDASAAGFVDEELAKAEASVHLLGESAGWKPEGLDEIVKLQLARAKARAESPNAGPSAPPFRRIIWAPKIFQRGGRADAEPLARDPQEVLGRFGADCEGDKVFGEDFGSFRDLAVQCLDQWKPKPPPAPEEAAALAAGKSNQKVLLLHHEDDRALARELKKALLKYQVEAVLPARDGDEVQRKNFDRDLMKKCDAIVICWGSTTETWTRAQASQLEDFRAFGRSQIWEPRSVVLGPPPGTFKAEFQEDGPPSEIDEVVVVHDLQAIPPEEVRKLIPRRPPAQP